MELIAEVLGWNAYERHTVLETLGSLCRHEGNVVSLFHKSLPDWLGDPAASGRFHASAQMGHERLARHVQTVLLRDPEIKEVWSDYLLQYGAVHAANWQRPDLGACFLTTQLRSKASNRLLPGPLRIAIDAYLQALRYCNAGALRSISSNDLADLISRTDSRHILGLACELLIERESEWESAFASSPLDSRGATLVVNRQISVLGQVLPHQAIHVLV